MLNKNIIRLVQSLQKKNSRVEEGLYVIEGDKLIREFILAGRDIRMLIAKPEFISSINSDLLIRTGEVVPCSYEELRRISSLKTPHNALALVPIPPGDQPAVADSNALSLFLDSVQDPGNLGTIIRAAAWFGIDSVVCSRGCVDVYNPKVIQATMGAILHVRVSYADPEEYLSGAKESKITVYGTVMDGDNIYRQDLDEKGIIVFGNESKGISPGVAAFLDRRISIPRFTSNQAGIDSLNAGMAVSVVLSEFRRRSAGL